MSEVVAIVEGQTEQVFIQNQLAAHLGAMGITLWAVLPGRSRRQGGVKSWATTKEDIKRTLKEGRYCTTMFDFYALPNDWPGRAEATKMPWTQRGEHIEKALLNCISNEMGDSFNPQQFIPYIQMHEFEALLFSDINVLAKKTIAVSYSNEHGLRDGFQKIVDEAGNPEAINDHYDTCPSRRIKKLAHRYRKKLIGPTIASEIGLAQIKNQCTHFSSWIQSLEKLAP